ncbi:sulfotransferase [Vibrio sp. WXL210]|uniref:sulfotransferase n=1 Tax=Vibrio sp. WXL210 TaxID=3450709 RepID=UPI003EC69BBD
MGSNKKIFQIGFNKCGTLSLHHYFINNKLNSVHWDNGQLSKAIYRNKLEGRALLDGYESFDCFTDMEHMEEQGQRFFAAVDHFESMAIEYPNSVFILNVRDVNKWLNSRRKHSNYMAKSMVFYGLKESELRQKWALEFDSHVRRVKDYFKDSNRLLIFDLDSDDSDKISVFLKAHGFEIIDSELPHSHNTKQMLHKRNNENINNLRDLAISFERLGDIESASVLMNLARKLRPEGELIAHKSKVYDEYLNYLNK